MTDVLPALVTAGVGLVLLVLVLVAVIGPARRFGRARAALRTGVGRRLATLSVLRNARVAGRRLRSF